MEIMKRTIIVTVIPIYHLHARRLKWNVRGRGKMVE
jgi:hypothetical protein